jgi:hypothetical protein
LGSYVGKIYVVGAASPAEVVEPIGVTDDDIAVLGRNEAIGILDQEKRALAMVSFIPSHSLQPV